MKRLYLLSILTVFAAAMAVLALVVWPLPATQSVPELKGDAKRGAYLARLSGCVTCHTAPGGKPMSGGAALESKFGNFYAPNITPDAEYGIGRWTFQQFARAVRQGVSPDGESYYPAFPFEFYASLTDRDLADIWEALQAVPAVAAPSTPNAVKFPFNIRLGLKPWRSLFERVYTYKEDPSRSEAWNQGRYLVLGPTHCAACHSPRNLAGGLAPEGDLSGDPVMQDGGASPSITSHDLLANGWTKENLVSALKTGVLPDGDTLGGSMAEVVHGSTRFLLSKHLDDMATYLLDIKD
ncbi:cytochrome c [Devosia neptuniae]|jgi:mono/diheme cytochrome c family protein|uniref:c-type cytochrome n=1 Tax=Devosia TaxID=46913 RepID=UPI0022AF4E85|nr:cytochrome c [Devosia neptuniae]MCZ4346835.1 cytochrome c [Devosia neptuniae]